VSAAEELVLDELVLDELVLGIDAGGSSTRWLLVRMDGSVLASGSGGPVSGIELGAAGREDAPAFANLAKLLANCVAAGRPVRAVAGVTGLDSGTAEARRLQEFIAARLELDEERVSVLGDVVTAYLSAFEAGEGVLVYGGTGSVALHLARDGSSVRAGGHGYLIDDAGGGFWIGKQALKTVLRRSDVTGAPAGTALATALYKELGGSQWGTVRAAVYGGGRARVAALTPLVAVAARRGDRDALSILAAAGEELARLAVAVIGRLGQSLPVALAGGVALCGDALVRPLRDALPAGVPLEVAASRPVEAAARLAMRLQAGEVELPPN